MDLYYHVEPNSRYNNILLTEYDKNYIYYYSYISNSIRKSEFNRVLTINKANFKLNKIKI